MQRAGRTSAGLSRLLEASSVPPGAPRRRRSGVDLVDEQDRWIFCSCLSTPSGVARNRRGTWCRRAARPCRARRDVGLCQDFGNVAFDDAAARPFGDRRLADAGLADQQRVVLAPAAQDLDDVLRPRVAADQRVDLAFAAPLRSGSACSSRAGRLRLARRFAFGFRLAFAAGAFCCGTSC